MRVPCDCADGVVTYGGGPDAVTETCPDCGGKGVRDRDDVRELVLCRRCDRDDVRSRLPEYVEGTTQPERCDGCHLVLCEWCGGCGLAEDGIGECWDCRCTGIDRWANEDGGDRAA